MSRVFVALGMLAGGMLIGIAIGGGIEKSKHKDEGLNVLVYEHDGVDYIMAESNGSVTILRHTK